jgi:hypothetical protein
MFKTIVEALGGKSGQQTISEVSSFADYRLIEPSDIRGHVILDNAKVALMHASTANPISGEITERDVVALCLEVDESLYNLIQNKNVLLWNRPFPDSIIETLGCNCLQSVGIRGGSTDEVEPENYIVTGDSSALFSMPFINSIALEYPEIAEIAKDHTDVYLVSIFKKGTMQIEEGTKKKGQE